MGSVVLKNINKVYEGGVQAVKDFNLEIEDREFIVLVGPSGCGKSTTLRMVAGLEEISSGELYIDGKLCNHVPPQDRNIAMVFQNYALYPHKTVYDNMAFGLKMRKFDRDEIDKRVKQAADMLGLRHVLDRKPAALSGGQRQRVAVGRAIVRQPSVFLFDEPLSNLDAKLRSQMRTELSKLHTRLQTTMIYVTHDQLEAMTLADRIVVLKDGITQQVGTPLEIYENPATIFVAGFIGSPPMNFVRGRVETAGEAVRFKTSGIDVRFTPDKAKKLQEEGYVGKEVIFGIRPQEIHDRIFFPEASEDHVVRGIIDVVEPVGSETFLQVSVGENLIMARMSASEKYVLERELELVFNMDRVHVFDISTERAVF
ncbi:MAG: sn-glycerol-3-phosphate ABC transporter ATP-binding protein UgpC [Candidatus Hydrogenedentota bacterium]|nr:MAG: sn-glycerol-3-phosphate ABC transporter ATP-binding protein UgpC [Candidatus Hydrogenedentota bacterium]